jgi:hypothetical protein
VSQSWIKVETISHDKIEVARIASALKMDVFAVLGRLVRIWCYFDVHSRAGRIDGIDGDFVDRLVGHAGFSAEMVAVNWMAVDDAGIALPNFDRHNGGGAKARAQGSKRQGKHRAKKGGKKRNAQRNGDVTQEALPEKTQKRERKEREEENKTPAGSEDLATLSIVHDFKRSYAGSANLKPDAALQKEIDALCDELGRAEVAAFVRDPTRGKAMTLMTLGNTLRASQSRMRGNGDGADDLDGLGDFVNGGPS